MSALLPLLARQPDEPFARIDGQHISADAFARAVAGLADRLPNRPFTVNLCEDRYRFLQGFAAAMLRGQTTLLPANRQAETIRRTMEQFPDSYRLTDDDAAPRDALDVRSAGAADGRRIWDCRIPGDRLAIIAFTSGSTGAPTPIRKSWGTLTTGAVINHQQLLADLGSPAAVVATIPPQHMYGLETTVMLPLHVPVAVDAGRPLFPQDVSNALAQAPRPRVLVSTPVHLKALVDAQMRFPRVDRVVSATAPLSQALARRVVEAFGADMLEIYGFSEAGCVATRRTASETGWRPYPQFRFHSAADGWQVTADHMPEPVPVHDLLQFDDAGHFRLAGRAADMVNIAGKRGSLGEITQYLLGIEGVRDGVVFEPPEPINGVQRLAALVVAPGLSVRQIKAQLRDRLDPVFLPRPLLVVERLPRTEAGKLPRDALLSLFEQRQLRATDESL